MYTCKLIIYKNTFISDEPSCVVLVVNILYIQASSTQILKEFKRLQPNTATDDIEDLLTSGLQKYRKAIIKVLSKKKKTTFSNEIEDASVHYRTESQRNCKLSLIFNVYHVILMIVILFFILQNEIPCWLYTRNFLIHTIN